MSVANHYTCISETFIYINKKKNLQSICPGFGQDRVNFHQKPGGDTASRADPNWSNRTGYSKPCAVMLGSRGKR